MSVESLHQELAALRQQVTHLQQERDRSEQRQKAAQHKLSLILDHLPIAVLECSPTGEIIDWNPAAQQILGHSKQDAIHRPVTEVLVSKPDAPGECLVAMLLSQTQQCCGVYEHWIEDKQQVFCEWYSIPLEDIENQTVGTLAFGIDISDRKRVEDELRASEMKLRDLFTTMTDLVLILDAKGRYVEIAPTNPNSLYRPAEQALGKTMHEMMPQEQADFFLNCIQESLQSKQTISVEYFLEIGHELKWFEARISPREGDQVVWVIRDISIRKQAEQKLQASQEFLDNVINGVSDPIFVKNEARQWVLLNDAFCEFVGHSKNELLGKSNDDYFPQEQAEISNAKDQLAFTTEVENINEGFLTDFSGAVRAVATKRSWFQDGTGNRFLVGVIRDISDRKQAEQVLQQAKADLENQVTHRTIELQHTVTQLQQQIIDRQQTEQALRQSEERYRSLISATSQIVWTVPPDGVVVEDLPSWRAYTGQFVAEIQDWGWLNAIHPEDREPIEQTFTRSGHAPRPYQVEAQVERGDGVYRYFLIRGVPVLNEDGSLREWIGTCTDIHDRKQSEAKLEQTQNFLTSVLDALPVAVLAKEAEDLRYALWNPTATELLGFTAEEALGKNDYDLFPKRLATAFHRQDREVLDRKQVLEIAEETIQTGKGETRILHTKKATILDSDGTPQYLLVITEDITEQKQAEDSLRRINKAVESTSDAIAMADLQGRSIYHNPAFIELFGYTVDELNTLGHSAIYPDLAQIRTVFDSIVQGLPWRGEVVMRSRFGHTRQIELRADAIRDQSGQVIGAIGTHTDITDRKQSEAALRQSEAQLRQQALDLEQTLRELQQTQAQLIQSEKMSSLGQLVAGVAHEINNPVNFIYGNLRHAEIYIRDLLSLLHLYQQHYPNPNSEILAEASAIDLDFLLEDLPNLLSSMKVGADRIQKIVASLRIFSRMDEAEFKVVDIHEGMDSTLLILQNRFKGKQGYPEIQLVKEYNSVPLVECYAGQLNQVFMNILSNALDALEDRDQGRTVEEVQKAPSLIQIRTQVTRTDVARADQVDICIADNGPGMTETVRQRLFDPFFTTKPVGKGTGMGLSISYQIITEKHRGTLRCSSIPGQGTEFIITIPLKQPSKSNQP